MNDDIQAQALKYLRSKFPEVDPQAFYNDYNGNKRANIIEPHNIMKAAYIDEACETCTGKKCSLPDTKSRPVVSLKTSRNGLNFLSIGWTCGEFCRFNPLHGEFGRLYRSSGLLPSQLTKDFEHYQICNNPELKRAKVSAMKAGMTGSCLILAGRRGTGKTHLAISIAIKAMKNGHAAIFRLVNELLDEIRHSVAEGEYFDFIQKFKTVPCLILDDLGKEKTTDAGLDYLYQIIDYRYRHELQTIITTNALTIEELASWGAPEYLTPIVSRLIERGEWVTLKNVKDFRVTGGADGEK